MQHHLNKNDINYQIYNLCILLTFGLLILLYWHFIFYCLLIGNNKA